MKQSTIINHEKNFIIKAKDVFSRALSCCLTSKELTNLITEKIYNDKTFKKLPRYARSYIQGYIHALDDKYWENVMWVFPYNGKVYKSFSELPKEGKKLVRERKIEGLHVYIKNPKKNYTGKKEQLEM